MKNFTRTVFALSFAILFCLSWRSEVNAKTAGHTIFAGGRSDRVIVLPANPSAVESNAAGVLQQYLKKMGAGEVQIVKGAANVPAAAKTIILGWTPESRKLTGLTPEDMKFDEYLVKLTPDGTLLLTGHPSRGTMYAVSEFLERYCGVRWWTAAEETVPALDELVLPVLEYRHVPSFAIRVAGGSQYLGDKTMAERVALLIAMHKINGRSTHRNFVPTESYYRLCMNSHTMERLVPDEEFFNSHKNYYDPGAVFPGSKPEYFALRDGRRMGAAESQPCLTNPEVLDVAFRNASALLRRVRPDARILWVTQNDNTNNCECENCLAAISKLGNRSDLNIDFCNKLQARLDKEFPGLIIETFAYQFTLPPPKTIKPSDKVHVRVCLIEADAAHPIDSPQNRKFHNWLLGWRRITPNINIWHYITNFTNFGLAHPTFDAMISDLRLFHSLGAKDVFSEDSSIGGEFSWFAAYRGYLNAHLLNDTAVDVDALTADFFHGYYGAGGDAMLRFKALFDREAAAAKLPMTCYQFDTVHWLSRETIMQADKLLDEAEAAVPAGSEFARRISIMRTIMDWTKLWRSENNSLAGLIPGCQPILTEAERKTLLAGLKGRLMQVPTTPGWYTRRTTLHYSFEAHLDKLRNEMEPALPHVNLPAELQDVPAQELIILPFGRMNMADNNRGIHDYKAPFKKTNRLTLGGYSRPLRSDVPSRLNAGNWEVLFEVRLPDAVTNPVGDAFIGGLYAYGTNWAEKTAYTFPANALSRDNYRLFSLGTIDFKREYQIYFEAVNNPSVPEILVGRIFLRKK